MAALFDDLGAVCRRAERCSSQLVGARAHLIGAARAAQVIAEV